MKGFSDFLYFWCTISCIVCLLQVIQSFPFLPGLKEVPRRLKKFIDWNYQTPCVVRGEDARTRIGSDVCKKTIDQRVYAIKKAYRNSANKISLSGNVFSDEKWAPKKTKSFGGKIVHRKKSLRFWIVFSWAKDIQVFWREKSCIVPFLFSHQRSRVYFVLTLDPVQIRIFFSLSATLHTQKKVKERAYILTCH